MSKKDTGGPDAQSAGVSRLISRVAELHYTGEKISQPWNGRLNIQPAGKFALIMTMTGRAAPTFSEEQAAPPLGKRVARVVTEWERE